MTLLPMVQEAPMAHYIPRQNNYSNYHAKMLVIKGKVLGDYAFSHTEYFSKKKQNNADGSFLASNCAGEFKERNDELGVLNSWFTAFNKRCESFYDFRKESFIPENQNLIQYFYKPKQVN